MISAETDFSLFELTSKVKGHVLCIDERAKTILYRPEAEAYKHEKDSSRDICIIPTKVHNSDNGVMSDIKVECMLQEHAMLLIIKWHHIGLDELFEEKLVDYIVSYMKDNTDTVQC